MEFNDIEITKENSAKSILIIIRVLNYAKLRREECLYYGGI